MQMSTRTDGAVVKVPPRNVRADTHDVLGLDVKAISAPSECIALHDHTTDRGLVWFRVEGNTVADAIAKSVL